MGTVVVDAGILIAILDRSDVHHASARAAIAGLRGAHDLVVPASAYSELMVHPYEHGLGDVRVADDLIDSLPIHVEAATRDVAREAARLRARLGRSLRLPDALVIGTAIVVGADRIVTTDTRWPNVGIGVDVVRRS
jgi:predicted nucleic acid-binding protein